LGIVGEWRERSLGELTDNFDGVRVPVKESDRRPGHYPYYGASGVVDHVDNYLFDGEYLLIAEDGENLRTRNTPVAFLARGKFWVNNHAHIVRGNSEADTRFLMYALTATDISGYLTGSTMPKLTQGNMNRISLLTPPLDEQRAIAHILGTLDDKIELNRRMNETLEAMARALFKSWFVDFDPVRAKAADLIRDGVLEIGDGYRAKNSELGTSGLPFIRAGDLNDGFDTAGAELLTEDSVAKAGSKVCRVGDVAFTSKGTIGRFARVTEHTSKFVYSPQVCYWRSLDPTQLHPAVLYCWMQSDDFKEQITAIAGQTDMAPYVSLQDQRRMSMPIFPKSQHAVASRIEPLLARQSCNAAQTKTLDELCDALLLKLISGALRVKDAERFLRRMSA
jgi:type I restriction enzyme S subunit